MEGEGKMAADGGGGEEHMMGEVIVRRGEGMRGRGEGEMEG